MDKKDIEQSAKYYALDTYLSDYGDSTYEDILEAFYKNIVPYDVTIWQPFEDFDLSNLAYYIETTFNDFTTFANKIKEIK